MELTIVIEPFAWPAEANLSTQIIEHDWCQKSASGPGHDMQRRSSEFMRYNHDHLQYRPTSQLIIHLFPYIPIESNSATCRNLYGAMWGLSLKLEVSYS